MRELKFEEVSSVSGGGCANGFVDATTLVSNVGCITEAEFDLLESQLFGRDQEPPAFTESFGSISPSFFFRSNPGDTSVFEPPFRGDPPP